MGALEGMNRSAGRDFIKLLFGLRNSIIFPILFCFPNKAPHPLPAGTVTGLPLLSVIPLPCFGSYFTWFLPLRGSPCTGKSACDVPLSYVGAVRSTSHQRNSKCFPKLYAIPILQLGKQTGETVPRLRRKSVAVDLITQDYSSRRKNKLMANSGLFYLRNCHRFNLSCVVKLS